MGELYRSEVGRARAAIARHWPFLAFTAAFALLAAYVFWGCWPVGVTFVSPDDGIDFHTSYGDVLAAWVGRFCASGKVVPTDVFWSGLAGSPLFCRELKYASAAYFAGLGLAYFLRGRGLSRLASYGAGLLLAFCGYWLTLFSAGHAGWFVWMTYGVFAFGLADRAVEKGLVRHWLLLGAFVAWGSFQQPDLWLMFTIFTGAYFIFRSAVFRPGWKRIVRGVALSAAAFFLVGAPGIRSAFTDALAGREKQIEESKGSVLSGGEKAGDDESRWIFVTNWSLPPAETAEFACSRINGDTSCPLTLSVNRARGTRPYVGALGRPYGAKEGNYRQHSLYVGWVTCLLAALGVFGAVFAGVRRATPFDRRAVAFFAVSALAFYLLSLGRHCEPVYRLVYALPLGDSIRAPVKWHHLTELCLCALAGFGIDAIWRWFASLAADDRRRALLLKCALGAFVLFGAIDLAGEARRFCAPVDYSRAIKSGCSSQLTVLARQQFQNPQVAEMVRSGRIISVASWLGSPDAYLVQVLQPLKPAKPAEPKTLPVALGLVSVLSAIAVAVVSCSKRLGSFAT